MKDGENNNIRSWEAQFFMDAIIALFVLIFIFLVFIHLLFDPLSTELVISGQSINHGFPNNQVFIWYLLNSIIAFVYLTVAYISSFGKWRFFLLPCILYFPCNLLFLYSDFHTDNYWDYIFSTPGTLSILLFSSIIFLLDNLFKRNILAYSIQITLHQMFQEIIFSWNSKLNHQIKNFLRKKSTFSKSEYLSRAYYLQDLVERLQTDGMIINSDLIFHKNEKKDSSLFFGLFIILLTALFFLEGILPSNMKTFNFGNIVIESYGFDDVKTLVWYTSKKIYLGSVLIIWFITSPHWWRCAILLPIIFYLFQLWEAFQPETQIESAGNLMVFPLVFAIITLVLMISRIVRTHSITMDYKALLERELDQGISKLSSPEKPTESDK